VPPCFWELWSGSGVAADPLRANLEIVRTTNQMQNTVRRSAKYRSADTLSAPCLSEWMRRPADRIGALLFRT